jgi:hypothetical protein
MCRGVDGVRRVHFGLAAVDGGERAAVQHELGTEGAEGGQDGIPVIDQHGVDVGSQHLVL